MRRNQEMLLIQSICLILVLLLLPSPTRPPATSAVASANSPGANLTVTIQAPQYVFLNTSLPVPVHVSMNNSEPVKCKLSLHPPDGKHAAKFWNGTTWVYPGGSWDSMLTVEPDFEGFLFFKPQESYSGWKALRSCSAAEIRVSIRYPDSTSTIKFSSGIDLIDCDGSNRTRGLRISGTAYGNDRPLEEGFVRIRNGSNVGNDTNFSMLNNSISFAICSSPTIGGDSGSAGTFELWVPAGTYTLEVFSSPLPENLLYIQNITVNSNMTIDFGKPPPPPPPLTGDGHPMIVEVYYNCYGGGSDEYLALYNQQNSSMDLTNWTLTDGEHIHVMTNISLAPFEKVYLARDPERLFELTTHPASMTFPLSLSDTDDSLSLIDAQGRIVDSVAWGEETVEGCNGTIESYPRGRVLRRCMKNGSYLDSNEKSDWESGRVFMVGQSDLPFSSFDCTGNLTVFVSPDSSYRVIASELAKAEESIKLNMYELTNFRLYESLLEALNRSVQIALFLEGSPVGGISDTELFIASRLSGEGADIRFIHNNETVKDRYNYDHAKYCVIDDDTLILDSENWKQSGIPVDPSYGNRGWGVVIRDREIAGYFERMFDSDSEIHYSDVVGFGTPPYLGPASFSVDRSVYSGTYTPIFPEITVTGDIQITPVIAPDHTLREDSILGMIDGASVSVYVEQLQCSLSWGEGLPNLYLEALIRAAERGCEVKVLLDSKYVDILDEKSDNYDTIEYINAIAEKRGLGNLRAKLIVLKGLDKLHNKGVIVDGEYTLVSSINWGRGAVLLNREAGVIIRSREAAGYFSDVFLYDWNLKERPSMKEEKDKGIATIQYYCSGLSILGGAISAWYLKRK